MSEKLNEYKELLHNQQKRQIPVQTEWATVKEIDWDDKTMTCIGQNNELEYFDILLGLGSIFKKPKIGSTVLIGSIDNSEESFMLDCEEFDEMIFTSGETEFTINQDGYIFKQGNESFQKILIDFMTETIKLNQQLQLVIVSAGVSPNVPALEEIVQSTNVIKQRLNSILIQ